MESDSIALARAVMVNSETPVSVAAEQGVNPHAVTRPTDSSSGFAVLGVLSHQRLQMPASGRGVKEIRLRWARGLLAARIKKMPSTARIPTII
jgi:hypothetical protein